MSLISTRVRLAILSLLLPALAALAQDAAWIVKRVQGYRIGLAVESVFEPARPGTEPRHAPALDHRLVISVREAATGRLAPIDSVSANVAESGYSGETFPLAPRRSGNDLVFEGQVRLKVRTTYRILVHATPAGGGRALEAQFEYRHHH